MEKTFVLLSCDLCREAGGKQEREMFTSPSDTEPPTKRLGPGETAQIPSQETSWSSHSSEIK